MTDTINIIAPEGDYHSSPGVNWSTLVYMATSPRAYRHAVDVPREDTPAMALGRAVHCRVLESAHYESRYIVRPEGVDLRTKAGKAWLETTAGRDVLTLAQSETVERIVDNLIQHEAWPLLVDTRREQIVRWVDPATGLACRGRIDAVAPSRVVDLKTSFEIGRLDRMIEDRRIYGQLPWYRDAAARAKLCEPAADCYVIALQTTPPWDVDCVRLGPETVAAGQALYRRLLDWVAACTAANVWPGARPRIRNMELSDYAMDRAARLASGIDE